MAQEILYEAIKTRWDATTALTSAVGILYLGEAPEPASKSRPFAVLTPSDDSRSSGGFSANYYQEVFEFHVVGDNLVDLKAVNDSIQTAFQDQEQNISATGLGIINIQKVGGSFIEGEYAFESVQQYKCEYRIAR